MISGSCIYCPDFYSETVFPCDICPIAFKSECSLYEYLVEEDEYFLIEDEEE